ncbi:hypothetical protein D3C86_1838880 [compost metagenome]
MRSDLFFGREGHRFVTASGENRNANAPAFYRYDKGKSNFSSPFSKMQAASAPKQGYNRNREMSSYNELLVTE